MSKPLITCVFPVHNEAQILRREIDRFINAWKQSKLAHPEIILVENGSNDSSWKIILSLQKTHRHIVAYRLLKASYGQALKTGILNAKGKYIFIFNVDFFDINFAKNALHYLKVTDIVVGSKTLAASRDNRNLIRKLVTYFFNVMLRLVLNYPGSDTHGIKAMRNSPLITYSANRCRTKNELFDTELIIRATRWGGTFVELPVTVNEIRPTRYFFVRRIWLTVIDLFIAFWSKYIGTPNLDKKIVVADDYGLSAKVNKAILTAADKGEIEYVSVLANFATKKDIRQLKRHIRKVKISLHANFIEGRPISRKHSVNTLIDKSGYFYPLPIYLIRLLLGLIDTSQLEKELISQIQVLKRQRVQIYHLDSHQHTHVFPPIWKIFVTQSTKWNIKFIRSQDSTRYALLPSPIKYAVYNLLMILFTLRFGANSSSPKELNEIITHPGASY